jgi:hypothetical protein
MTAAPAITRGKKISYGTPAALVARHGLSADLAGNLAAIEKLTDELLAPSEPDARRPGGGEQGGCASVASSAGS